MVTTDIDRAVSGHGLLYMPAPDCHADERQAGLNDLGVAVMPELSGANMQGTRPTTIGDFDWIVLNRESQPERLAQFRTFNDHLALPAEIVAATEGGEVDRRELAQLDLIDANNMDWDADAVGNAVSHWLCWHQAVETQRPTAIIEDSSVLRRDFVGRMLGLIDALPADWDIVHLGYNTSTAIDFDITPDCRFRGRFSRNHSSPDDLETFAGVTGAVAPLRMHNVFGSFAYLVSPSGAQKLIDGCFPLATKSIVVPALQGRFLARSIDGLMNQLYSSVQAYVCFPPLALSTYDPVLVKA